jgi:hypothetical protein
LGIEKRIRDAQFDEETERIAGAAYNKFEVD